jgi:hypothetical protein
MVMAGWCFVCRCSGETVDHLLLQCPMSCQIWSFVFKLFGVDWVMSGVFRISWLVGEIGLENTLQKFRILSLHV